jgi:hypothetical protein
METRRHNCLKNALSVTALLISLAALQSPLWRPASEPYCVTAKAGGTVTFDYNCDIEKATILHRRTATLSVTGPRQVKIHGVAPGRTALIIRYGGGESRLYKVVILPG